MNATVKRHLKHEADLGACPEWVLARVKQFLYVDDICTSFATEEQMIEFKGHVQELFKRAGMTIHKFKMSGKETEQLVSVLGVKWSPGEDYLMVDCGDPSSKIVDTKRKFLSELSSVFDPLGLISPWVIRGKILMQEIWRLEAGWDDRLPEPVIAEIEEWLKLRDEMNSLRITRSISTLNDEFELHLFVDASEKAYAACLYRRNDVDVQLICSKAKVAPMKKKSLPRLELCAAVLGVKLLSSILPSLEVQPTRIFAWSDSQITLAWIQSSATDRWSTFVSNRIALIQENSNGVEWRFCPGKDNVSADLNSRGAVSLAQMESFWISGPEWLGQESKWPVRGEIEATLEEKKQSTFVAENVAVNPVLNETSWIAAVEKSSETDVILQIQAEVYEKEVHDLRTSGAVSRKSSLWCLNPFLDDENVLRVTGRIQFSELPADCKHPIILPGTHPLVKDMMWSEHLGNHDNVSTILTSLRERFFIVRGRRALKDMVKRCVPCVRFDTKLPVIGNRFAPLPKDRVTLQKPFTSLGTDFAGPIFVKSSDGSEKRAYIVVFVCSASRAVCLEVVTSMNTQDFLYAFRRFVARMNAQPKIIRSDNGLAFKKAAESLKIDWRFQPPASSWWGGQFESFVKLMKRPLRKVLGSSLVTLVELETIIMEIENSVNSRPLTVLSEDANEPNPITPFQLLGKVPGISMREEIEWNEAEMCKRVRYVNSLIESLKKRWKSEYLTTMMEHSKKFYKRGNVPAVGDTVIVVMEHKGRMGWPLGRVSEVFPGKDGIVRALEIETEVGKFIRPVQKIIPLEMKMGFAQDDDEMDDEMNVVIENDVNTDDNNNIELIHSSDNDEITGTEIDAVHDAQKDEVVTRGGRKVKAPVKLDL